MPKNNTPTTAQIAAFLKKNGPTGPMEIATHFDCLMEPTPNGPIRTAIWLAVDEGEITFGRGKDMAGHFVAVSTLKKKSKSPKS